MYVMVCKIPDIVHVVIVVSCYIANHRKEYCQAVKWILRYLKDTVDLGFTYG